MAEDAPHMTVAVEAGGAVRDEEGAMLQKATVEDVIVGFGKAGAANANDIETGTVAESAGPDDLNAGRQRQTGQRLASEESLIADMGDGVVKDDLGDVATMGKSLTGYHDDNEILFHR